MPQDPDKAQYNAKAASARYNVTIQGFTIVELLVTVAIIFTIAAIAVPKYFSAIDEARIAKAVGDLRTIGTAVVGYEVVNRQYPTTLADVGLKVRS